MEQEPPLFGFHWNEAKCNAENGEGQRGLLTIIAHDLYGTPHVIGTAFIVKRSDRKAWCVSAAHIFSHIRDIQSRAQKHAPSALAPFLPPPPKLLIELARIQIISIEGPRAEVLTIDAISFDENSDLAVFSISLISDSKEGYFNYQFEIDDVVPEVGDLVCVMGIADQEIDSHQIYQDGGFEVGFTSRPILRVGRVLGLYPQGRSLCKGPCIETTIPVFSGMSGGPALIYGEHGEKMIAFGFISCGLDAENKQDRSIEGHSIIALLPCKRVINETGTSVVALKFPFKNESGVFEDIGYE